MDLKKYISDRVRGLGKVTGENALAAVLGMRGAEQPQNPGQSEMFSAGAAPYVISPTSKGSFSKVKNFDGYLPEGKQPMDPDEFDMSIIEGRLKRGEGYADEQANKYNMLAQMLAAKKERNAPPPMGEREKIELQHQNALELQNSKPTDGFMGGANKDEFKRLVEERNKAQKWLEIGNLGQSAVDEAGETGVISNSLGWLGAQLGSPTQKQRMAGNTRMDRLQARGIELLKSPGTGGLTDKDMDKLMAALPTSNKLKSQNLAAIQEINKEYTQQLKVLDMAIKFAEQGMPPVQARQKAMEMAMAESVPPEGLSANVGPAARVGAANPDDEARIAARMAQLKGQ